MLFFYLGFYCKQKNYIYTDYQKKDIFICLIGIISSIYFFSIFRNGTSIVEYGILYWLICLSAIWGILSLCKLLNKVHFTAIDNISIGTIVIMGLHRMFIGATNYGISMLFGIQREIVYPLITAILIALFFVALEYPIIIFFKNNFPFMLGKNRIQKC